MVHLIVLLKIQGHPLKILLERTRGLLNKERLEAHLVFVLLCYPFLCVVYPFVFFCFLLFSCVVGCF
jgi:hypothetical protein